MDLREIGCECRRRTEQIVKCCSVVICRGKNVSFIFLSSLVFVIVYVYRLWPSDGLYLTDKCRSNNRYCYTMAFYFYDYWLNINY